MHSVTEDLATALKQTKDILGLSEEKQWDQAEKALIQRDQLIKSALDQEITPSDADKIRTLIGKIKDLDKKITTLAEAQQSEISSEIKKQNKGKKMKAAYAQAKRL